MDYDALYGRLKQYVQDETMYGSIKEIIEDERSKEAARRRALQADGIARAKEQNVQLGRKCKSKPRNYRQVMDMYLSGSISMSGGAKLLNVSRTVMYRWVREEQEHRDGVCASAQA